MKGDLETLIENSGMARKNMNCLTQTGQWELGVDIEFKNKTRSSLHYNVFKVGSATDEYPLTITDPFTAPFTAHSNQKSSVQIIKITISILVSTVEQKIRQ